jgi:hypothetical protein
MAPSNTRPRLAATINTVQHLFLIAGVDSLFQNQQRMDTPHLNINYQPNPESTFWRS